MDGFPAREIAESIREYIRSHSAEYERWLESQKGAEGGSKED